MTRENAFHVVAAFFALAALYHGIGFISPSFVIPSAHWRHGLFIVINLLGVWLILWRPPWLIFPFALVTLQQLYSHGNRAWVWWHMNQRIDWISLGVIVSLPLTLALLEKEARERSQRTQKDSNHPLREGR